MYTHISDSESYISGSVSGAWSKVAAFASAVDANLDKWLADSYRLGLTEFRALALLSQSSDKELRITVLAQQVGLTSTSTTRLVSRLEAKGLARRDVCQDDGRGVYAVIDEPGEALLREVRRPYEDRIHELLSNPGAFFPHVEPKLVASALKEVTALVEK